MPLSRAQKRMAKRALDQGVIQMFRVNMGVKPGEKILILSDIPTKKEWKENSSTEIEGILAVTALAKRVAEIARKSLDQCRIDFYPYFSLGRSGVEPTREMARKMMSYDVIIAINSFSLTHTTARAEACRRGARVATMRGVVAEMFYADGSIAADYNQVREETEFLARFLTEALKARIVTRQGTDLSFDLSGRSGGADIGIYVEPGRWGNLPAGEAYIAPVEGTAHGRLLVPRGWFAGLREDMLISFEEGEVQQIEGGGEVREKINGILGLGAPAGKRRDRCNLAEFGIGTNPKARRIDITIEAEKIKGTIHIGIGDNSHMGGKVATDYHQDFVVPEPDVFLDKVKVMEKGVWMKR